jgi:tryptophan-rich hypothetical protein
MNHLLKSKWTSIQKLNGWRHYEVLNILKKKNKVEMFCVCKNDIKVLIPIQELRDKSKWHTGWIGKEQDEVKIERKDQYEGDGTEWIIEKDDDGTIYRRIMGTNKRELLKSD